MRISDWSSDVCSSDLVHVVVVDHHRQHVGRGAVGAQQHHVVELVVAHGDRALNQVLDGRLAVLRHPEAHDRIDAGGRSEEHTSELQSLMRISYAVFCLKKKTHNNTNQHNHNITH